MAWFNNDKAQAGLVQKMNQTIQAAIQNLFKVRWSALPRRATSAYLDLFHTTPRLDALDMIATDCANAIFKVYRKADLRTGRDDAEPVGDHPVYDLLENPIPDHPEFDGFMVRYLTHVYVELNGECFWIVLRDTKGRPREIYPIPANWCIQTPTAAQPWYLVVPTQNTAGATMQVDPRDVVWFKSPDAVSPFGRGRGRTEAVGDELETDEFAAKWAKNFFYNNASPESVMTIPGASPDTLKEFKASWNAKHQGVMNAAKMAFLGFDAKIHQLQVSPKEMDFNESRKFLRDQLNQHWQIPPEMMGILESSNRSTIDAAKYLYTSNVVMRRLMRFEAVVNRQLLPMFGSTEYAIKCDNLVPEDKDFNLKIANDGWQNGTLTRDQWLVKNNLPPVGGVLGQQYRMPINVVTVDSVPSDNPIRDVTPKPAELTTEEQQAGDVAQQPTGDDTSHPTTTTNELPTPKKTVKAFSDDQRMGIWKAFDKTAEGTEGIYESAVKRFAAIQKKAFQKAFMDGVGSGKKAKDAADRATLVAFNPKVDEGLKTALTPAWLSSMVAGEDHAYSVLGTKKPKSAKKDAVSGSFDVSNPRFLEWVTKYGLEKAKGMNDTTLAQLKAQIITALQEGIEEGMSERDIASAIMDLSDQVWGVMSTTRAHNIARTESAATVNYGSVMTYVDAGIEEKDWLATNDGRTRQAHAQEIKRVKIDEPFLVGGEKLMYPGDPSGSAENVCQCRCVVLPVVGEE